MLEGVVRFPPEFAAWYRAKGYWENRSLADTFADCFAKHRDRIAVVDGERQVSYGDLDRRSTNLALNLLEQGLEPLDRVVVQLPNAVEFVYLYFGLQKIGCIPIMALPTHRFREMSQFVELSGAVACVTADRARDFDYRDLVRRIRVGSATLRVGIVLRKASEGFLSLAELIDRTSPRSPEDLKRIAIDPEDPAVFQLSGGTTDVPKLIPRTHNDYVYNSKIAA
ncbi:MAG TPA: AMP-binding protein, partial [Candidatus Binatia bacterium]